MQVRVSSGFFIVSAILLLTLPLQWAAALFLSSLIHEVCHLFALKLTGVSVCGLRLTAGGAYLQTAEMTPLQESVSALAGPMGALLLLLTARWMPRTAICAAIQSAYHLLPLYPLDGGRVIRGLTRYFGWPRIISRLLEWGVILLLSLSGICYWGSVVGVCCWLVFLPLSSGSFKKNTLQRTAEQGTIVPPINARCGYDRISSADSSNGAETCPVYRRRIQ